MYVAGEEAPVSLRNSKRGFEAVKVVFIHMVMVLQDVPRTYKL